MIYGIKTGWAETDITPEKPCSLQGQFAERISEYVEKPVTATALAFDSGNDQAVFCSVDLVTVTEKLCERIKNNIRNNNEGLDVDKVIISAIHTHTGPGYTEREMSIESEVLTATGTFRNLLEENLPSGRKYVESAEITGNDNIITDEEMSILLTEKVSEAIMTAWRNRKESSFVSAFGRAPVGMCRRACYSDGSAQMWGNTDTAVFTELEGGNDSGIELIYVFDENKKLSGIVANLACPAQCVQHRLFVSPDFWGEVKMLLRRHFGEEIFLLPLCSAAGDQCPVDLVRWVEPESDVHDPNITRNNPKVRRADPSMFDIAGMKKAGKRIANEIIEVYNEGLFEEEESNEFVHEVHNFKLPLRRATLKDESEAKKAIREYFADNEGDVDFNDAANLQIYLGVLRRMRLQELIDVIDTEVHILRIGNIAFATNPFELFLNYGNQIKARSRAEQTFLVQLACCSLGYLPTEKAEKGKHYSAFIASGKVGHEGGDLLVRNTLAEINKLF